MNGYDLVMRRALLLLIAVTSLGSGLALAAGATRASAPTWPPARPSLDEALEEGRARCDALAGPALADCLRDA